jgi:hypothetical protein
MKKIVWNEDKALLLLNNVLRGNVGFEDCALTIEQGRVLDVLPNPSSKHPQQKMYVLEINNYAYCVPFVETDDQIFLKTLFPNRKQTARYLKDLKDE